MYDQTVGDKEYAPRLINLPSNTNSQETQSEGWYNHNMWYQLIKWPRDLGSKHTTKLSTVGLWPSCELACTSSTIAPDKARTKTGKGNRQNWTQF